MTTLPLITVRDIIAFPNNTLPLQMARPFTIGSVKESLAHHGGDLIVASQKLIEISDKPELNQIFDVACLCKIVNHVDFPDGSMKILVRGEKRFKIGFLEDRQGIRYGTGSHLADIPGALPEFHKHSILQKLRPLQKELSENAPAYFEYLEKTKEAFPFTMVVGQLLASRHGKKRKLNLDHIRKGLFFIDTLTEQEKGLINLNMARTHEVLASEDLNSTLEKIEALLET